MASPLWSSSALYSLIMLSYIVLFEIYIWVWVVVVVTKLLSSTLPSMTDFVHISCSILHRLVSLFMFLGVVITYGFAMASIGLSHLGFLLFCLFIWFNAWACQLVHVPRCGYHIWVRCGIYRFLAFGFVVASIDFSHLGSLLFCLFIWFDLPLFRSDFFFFCEHEFWLIRIDSQLVKGFPVCA